MTLQKQTLIQQKQKDGTNKFRACQIEQNLISKSIHPTAYRTGWQPKYLSNHFHFESIKFQ